MRCRYHLRGVDYAVVQRGHGKPLLLLHGFTGSAEAFAPFMDDFAADFQCIVPDLIGHGETEAPVDRTRYRMAETVMDLACLLDMQHISQVDVLGYSMGGRTALAFALANRHRVRRLILEGASPGLRTSEERADRVRRDEALADKIERIGISAFVDEWEKLPLFESQREIPKSRWDQQREIRLSQTVIGLGNSLRGMGTGAQPSYWDTLKHLFVPTLLVTGALDEKFTRIAKAMLQELPRARHEVVPNAGHTPHIEQPEYFSKLVKDFLCVED